MKRICAFISLLLLCECNNNNIMETVPDGSRMTVIKINMPGMDDLEENLLRQADILPMIDTFRFVKLELTDESLIGEIDKLDVFEDRMYIMDMMTSSLFVFDVNGKYLFKINNVGQGPQEYIQLDFFDIDRKNKQLVLTDLMGYWIMRYDMNGKFISRTKIPFWVEWVAPIDTGYSLYANYRDNSNKFKQDYNLYITDSLMHIRKAFFPYNSSIYNNPRLKLPPTGIYYYCGDSCRFLSRSYNTIYSITSEGLQALFKFDFGKFTFNSEKFNNRNELEKYLEGGNYYQLNCIAENKNFIHFSFYNAAFPFYFFGFYSKSTGNVIFSGSLSDGTGFGGGYPAAAFDDYHVTELKIDELLSWKEGIKTIKPKIENDWMKEMKKITDSITEDDNSVLLFYKLKPF